MGSEMCIRDRAPRGRTRTRPIAEGSEGVRSHLGLDGKIRLLTEDHALHQGPAPCWAFSAESVRDPAEKYARKSCTYPGSRTGPLSGHRRRTRRREIIPDVVEDGAQDAENISFEFPVPSCRRTSPRCSAIGGLLNGTKPGVPQGTSRRCPKSTLSLIHI